MNSHKEKYDKLFYNISYSPININNDNQRIYKKQKKLIYKGKRIIDNTKTYKSKDFFSNK